MLISAARAIYYPSSTTDEAVSQYGFYTSLELPWEQDDPAPGEACIRLTARNVYRLYVNGDIVMHGPARTAHGFSRVDEADITGYLVPGINHIAVEVMTYGNVYAGYSNDMSIQDGPGFLLAEVEADGRILSATGTDGDWKVCRISARDTRVTRLSHCREACEVYHLNDAYYLWRLGMGEFVTPVAVQDLPTLLPHEALLPTLEAHEFRSLMGYGTCTIDQTLSLPPLFFEDNPGYAPAGYYASVAEHPLMDCRRTVDAEGGVTVTRDAEGLTLTSANGEDVWVLFDGGDNFVGFPAIDCRCERAGTVDVVRTEILAPDGSVAYFHNTVTRLHVPAGITTFAAMEPGVARYLKVYFRGCGRVTLYGLSLLDYAYPDQDRTCFACSDDDINRLYKAAKRTLLDNTLDIFMDCPDRERGGWLCDSLWTSRAAALMLSDTRVEKEFLENFLLTPADGMFRGFFPEAYPGNKPSYKDMTGITTWTFWLMCQVCEYIHRTGDTSFRDRFSERVAAFVEGSRTFIGKSGLLENLPWLFIDWSLSNYGEYQSPISTPANALYAYALIKLGETFSREDWAQDGRRIRAILRAAIAGEHGERMATLTSFPDSFHVDKDGHLSGKGHTSETGLATALWAELFLPGETPALDAVVRDRMGPAPLYAADPLIGRSQLFIGLCIRLDMLAKRGHFPTLWKDLLAIYMPQLKEGPGTLWESTSIDTSSRCHGFTSHAGVHLLRDVLGLGIPDRLTKTVDVAPHICDLRWARGTMEVPEGMIAVSWRYDGESFALSVSLPADYDVRLTLPREVRMLEEDKVKVTIRKM